MAAPAKSSNWSVEDAAHLLNRAGFGGTPDEIAAFHHLGRFQAVQSLLIGDEDSDLFPPPTTMTPPIQEFSQLRQLHQSTNTQAKFEAQRALLIQQSVEFHDLKNWWLNRMRYTSYPLREKMTLFWHGHFATSSQKVRNSYLMWQQNETFRAQALGNFRQLTKSVSRDPAMMRYLDLITSSRSKPNENFAREVMELFLLGEGVVYTEKDVQEGAKAFTGYRIAYATAQFRFDSEEFDNSPKHFMGREGNFNGDDILDIIFDQPQCAQFIVRKVWSYFAGAPLSPSLEYQLGSDFRLSDYNIPTLLESIFTAPEFYSPEVVRNQIKSPVQWLIEMSRQLEAPLPDFRLVEPSLTQMGQTLFAPPNVKGWEGGRSWINSTTYLTRCNLAGIIVGSIQKFASLDIAWQRLAPEPLRRDPNALCAALSFRFFNAPLDPANQAKFADFVRKRGPIANDDSVREVVHLMMSAPEYQVT